MMGFRNVGIMAHNLTELKSKNSKWTLLFALLSDLCISPDNEKRVYV
jgi:hypothetical protein